MVDDVGAGLEHAGRYLAPRRRVREAAEVRRLAQVGTLDLDVRVDGGDAGVEPGLEALDQRGLDATHEPDPSGLGLQGRRGTDEERALVLREAQRHDVGLRREIGQEPVDEAVVDVREVGGGRRHRFLEGEADAEDQVDVLAADQPQQLAPVLAALGGFEFGGGQVEVVVGPVQASGGGVVERQVAAATDVVDEPDGGGITVVGGCVVLGRIVLGGLVLGRVVLGRIVLRGLVLGGIVLGRFLLGRVVGGRIIVRATARCEDQTGDEHRRERGGPAPHAHTFLLLLLGWELPPSAGTLPLDDPRTNTSGRGRPSARFARGDTLPTHNTTPVVEEGQAGTVAGRAVERPSTGHRCGGSVGLGDQHPIG